MTTAIIMASTAKAICGEVEISDFGLCFCGRVNTFVLLKGVSILLLATWVIEIQIGASRSVLLH